MSERMDEQPDAAEEDGCPLEAAALVEAALEAAEVTRFQSRDAAFADVEVLEGFQVLPAGVSGESVIEWVADVAKGGASAGGDLPAAAPTPDGEAPDGDSEGEGEAEPEPSPDPWEEARRSIDPAALDDMRLLRSSSGPCLYSARFMTDAYARWLFLAREGDDAATFASCVREESRLYPRPMKAASLGREPFHLSEGRLAELFEAMRDSEDYGDIRRTVASNGDVYYFSAEFLSDGYARSLAEWYSVEYWDNP